MEKQGFCKIEICPWESLIFQQEAVLAKSILISAHPKLKTFGKPSPDVPFLVQFDINRGPLELLCGKEFRCLMPLLFSTDQTPWLDYMMDHDVLWSSFCQECCSATLESPYYSASWENVVHCGSLAHKREWRHKALELPRLEI